MKYDEDPYMREMQELYKRQVDRESTYSRGVVCPSTYDTPGEAKHPCKLCDLCKEILFDRSMSREDPIRKRASAFNQKQRYYSNIVFISNPGEIVVLEYGKKLFDQLLAGQMGDSEWKNFMHPTEGRNLFITKIQGMTREQVDYKVDPKFTPSPLSPETMKLIKASKLVNLSDIMALIDSSKVKPVYQSKIFGNTPSGGAPKVEIRILPSWLGPQTTKFFQLVYYHQISSEDFKMVQAGKFNPILMTQSVVEEKLKAVIKETVSDNSPWSSIGEEPDYDVQAAPPPISKGLIETEGELEEEEKLCFGNYDDTDPKCTKCIEDGWGEGCKIAYQAKLAKRRAARRLAR